MVASAGSASASACTQTLFYFSFRSFRKHRRACERSERARTSAEREKHYFLVLVVYKSPFFIFYHLRSTDFKEINRGSLNRLHRSIKRSNSMVDKSSSFTGNYCHECNRYDEAPRAKYISRILKLLEHFYFYILHSYTCVERGKDVMSYFASSSSYSNTFLVIYNFSKTTDLSVLVYWTD